MEICQIIYIFIYISLALHVENFIKRGVTWLLKLFMPNHHFIQMPKLLSGHLRSNAGQRLFVWQDL